MLNRSAVLDETDFVATLPDAPALAIAGFDAIVGDRALADDGPIGHTQLDLAPVVPDTVQSPS